MGLKEYKDKRRFGVTAEPEGAAPRPRERDLGFVVQKHAARRLHYDFRLELDGVLKSWAIPKGPSLVPGDKRLAVEVEDHPIEYADFEGIIPAGEYGGGTVMVWDRGRWQPVGDAHEGLRRGKLDFVLEGEKLKGRWHLVRLRARKPSEKPQWLLLKSKDDAATEKGTPELVDARPLSVVSGRGMDAIASQKQRVWHSNRRDPFALGKVDGARPARMPSKPKPQLCTLVDEPPDGPEWLHEIKLDGYRLLARLEAGEVALLTRQGLDWSAQFPGIADAVAGLPCESAILDGEAVVLDEQGRSSFQALQGALGARRADLFYYAFDLLYVNGEDLTATPLLERKRALKRLLDGADPALRYSDHLEGSGPALFAKACEAGLEGLVCKRRDARYTAGRGGGWLKVKCLKRQELVIVGFTDPKRSRGGLGALLLGVHRDGALVYAGKVGTGFTAKLLDELRARLDPLVVKTPTVDAPAAARRGAHWVKPVLVAEVAFSEWTRDGVARHPSFQGLRGDKSANEVVREEPAPAPASASKKSSMRITNPERVLFPDPGITKRELMGYYEAVAERVVPAIAHRPLMIVRYPTGYEGIAFHQKHANKGVPKHLPRVEVGEEEPFIMVETLPDLLALVQLSTLELHIWGSTADALETPDTLVFDLDPDPTLSWKRVVAIARALDERLRAIGLTSFPRVTGGKGLHLVVPIVPEVDWEHAKTFTQTIAEWMARERPKEITANMAKARRTGKVYIDYLRNGRGATAVASYSTRARAGAPVAMPLDWDQLGETRETPPVFSLREAPAWIAKHVPWQGYEKARRGLKQVLK